MYIYVFMYIYSLGSRPSPYVRVSLWVRGRPGTEASIYMYLGERERAHLVVQLSRAVCIYICIYVCIYSVVRVPDTVNF